MHKYESFLTFETNTLSIYCYDFKLKRVYFIFFIHRCGDDSFTCKQSYIRLRWFSAAKVDNASAPLKPGTRKSSVLVIEIFDSCAAEANIGRQNSELQVKFRQRVMQNDELLLQTNISYSG